MIFSSNAVFPPATWYSDIIEHTEMVLNVIFFLRIILLSFTLWKGNGILRMAPNLSGVRLRLQTFLGMGIRDSAVVCEQ